MDEPDHERKARELLDHPESYPGLVERRRARVRLRAWRYPCFTPWRSWAVLEAVNHSLGIEVFVRRVSWARFQGGYAQPVTYGCEVPLGRPDYAALMSELHAIEIPPFPPLPPSDGRDGVLYGVEAGDAWVSARLNWWAAALGTDPPESWRPLVEWHGRATALFDSLLPAPTAQGT